MKMNKVFLSPSAQEFNLYPSGGNEEYYMNLIADKVQRSLEQSRIIVGRNVKNEDFNGAIARSNQDDYDLHVAIHSNASPENLAGKMKGPVIFYYPTSIKSACAADKFAKRFRQIYPDKDKIAVLPSSTLSELKRTKATGVYAEVDYHDNMEDEKWIKDNVDLIAEKISEAIIDYLNSDCLRKQ